MLALLSGFIGFLSSLAPEIIKMFQDSADKKHELDVMDKQAELGLKQAQSQQVAAETTAESEQNTSVQESYRAELAATGWVAHYAATVRPTITYAFFLLYAVIKIATYFYATRTISAPALPWQVEAAIKAIWTEQDMMMLSWIIGFWFGQRGFARNKS